MPFIRIYYVSVLLLIVHAQADIEFNNNNTNIKTYGKNTTQNLFD